MINNIDGLFDDAVCHYDNGVPSLEDFSLLLEDDKRHRSIVDAVTDYLYTIKVQDGTLISSHHNPRCVAVTGYTAEDHDADPILWLRMIHADDQRRVYEYLGNISRGVEHGSVEYRIVHRNCSVRWVKNTIIPVSNDEAGVETYDGIIKDVTDKKKIEIELESSVSLLKATIESTADGLLVVDLQGNIVCYNRRFVKMWHIPESFMEMGDGIKVFEMGIKQLKFQEECKKNILDTFLHPEREDHRFLEFQDGRVFERYSIPQKIGNTLVGVAWSFRDVTEQRKLEEQLRHAQKMEAIGRLTGGIAHDFNNLLTAMSSYLFVFKKKIPEGSALGKYVKNFSDCIEKAANLVQNLLAFSRKQVINPTSVNAHDLVQGIKDILCHLISEDILLEVKTSTEKLNIRVDRVQLEQVFLNLITNARDAMTDGGTISISTESVLLDEEFILKHGRGTPGKFVVFSISDTGNGICKEDQERIFEPFFTTKEVGKGTGLGLSTAYGIIEQHGGFVNVYSEVGVGTTFKLYFPETEQNELGLTPGDGDGNVVGGGETILLAEDEEGVRAATRELLEEYGYRVIEGKDGWDALSKFREHKEEIRLCILDVIMPNMNGKSVYDQIQKERPGLKVIFMSGYTADILDRNFFNDVHMHFIAKPFPSMNLIRKTIEVLRT